MWTRLYILASLILVGNCLADELWWSRQPLVSPKIPNGDPWVRNEVDHFVLAKLRKNGLKPSPQAPPLALIRRLTYDLTGLPPTPAQVDDFLKAYKANPDEAYTQLVNRLLDSPHYGERYARHWLDVAKYADTCGYDKDKLRPNAWPYRDYVIRAFNEDKPYVRFIQEQVAGDALFPDTSEGIIGLGFLAAGPWDFIGHAEVPETKIDGKVARNLDRDDMLSNVLNTFCAVTIQCARCHTHKGDPITQEHYYSLQSIFAAIDKADRPYNADPSTGKRRTELQAAIDKLRKEKDALESTIRQESGPELTKLDTHIKAIQPRLKPPSKRPEFGYHSQISKSPDTLKWVQIDLGERIDIQKIILHPCHDDHNNIGAGFGFPPRYKVIASNRQDFSRSQVLADQSKADLPNPGLAPVAHEVRSSARYIRIAATRLAPRSNDYIFALAEVQVLDALGKNRANKAKVTALDSIEAPSRWRKSNLTDGIWAKEGDPEAAGELAGLNQEKARLLEKARTPERKARLVELDKSIHQAAENLKKLPVGRMVYAAATEFKNRGNFKPTKGKPRPIRILHRGDVTQPRAEVRPGTLPLFPNEPWQFELTANHDESDRRAALARWLVREDHPLTWRVIANRVWQWHFGDGLVASPNDFGRLGEIPSHPELLDWLAHYFRDNGGTFKDFHRLLLHSATYRQSSTGKSPQDLEKAESIDSGNRLYWKMNRRRLSAEEVRDSILAASGKLNPKMGGPGFYLFKLEKTAHSPHYEYHKFNPEDTNSHRRSIYRFIVRSQPNPFMTTLDCADSSQSTPKRNETLTALQALSLLNNKFTLSMAKHFSARLTKEAGEVKDQIRLGHEQLTGRKPTKEETQLLQQYVDKHGMDNLCRALFNLSEFTFLD